ncbi:hypothetical protein SAMN05660776_1848 [Salegentibacter holothuriorum]|uniref:Uncharacterized protein n=1 Tax=Salegentibacter holothuriorum TaxID=241145 RepID=A0A1T5C6H5_9FLAO|nr:hypothetical protein SAMN05660776_1848 [Salegentibacter holothuriorum]
MVYNGLSCLEILPYKLEDIKPIFLNKLKEWKYENEFRIITEKQGYIDIEIKKIIFGSESSKFDKELITKLAENIHPNIELETYYDV